jgi:hypothetical protein
MGKKFFFGERRELLLSFMDQHKHHREAGTIEDFWHIIIPAYIAKFPEDNMEVAPTMTTGQPTKTKSGKPSKKHAPNQPKPLHEVGLLVDIVRKII